jgi:hypothetical protein
MSVPMSKDHEKPWSSSAIKSIIIIYLGDKKVHIESFISSKTTWVGAWTNLRHTKNIYWTLT